MNCEVVLDANPTDEDLHIVHQGLDDYNDLYAPEIQFQSLHFFLRDSGGDVAGGLLGDTSWGWLHVGVLWIRADVRRQGYGSAMLRAAEEEAVGRGCHHAFLDTTSFQALPFYLQHSYTLWGELDDFPRGHKRHFLQKALTGV